MQEYRVAYLCDSRLVAGFHPAPVADVPDTHLCDSRLVAGFRAAPVADVPDTHLCDSRLVAGLRAAPVADVDVRRSDGGVRTGRVVVRQLGQRRVVHHRHDRHRHVDAQRERHEEAEAAEHGQRVSRAPA